MLNDVMICKIGFLRETRLKDWQTEYPYSYSLIGASQLAPQSVLEIIRLEFDLQMVTTDQLVEPFSYSNFLYPGAVFSFNPALYKEFGDISYAENLPIDWGFSSKYQAGMPMGTWLPMSPISGTFIATDKFQNMRAYIYFDTTARVIFRLDYVNTMDMDGFLRNVTFKNEYRYFRKHLFDIMPFDESLYRSSIVDNVYESGRTLNIALSVIYTTPVSDDGMVFVNLPNVYWGVNGIAVIISWYYYYDNISEYNYSPKWYTARFIDELWLEMFLYINGYSLFDSSLLEDMTLNSNSEIIPNGFCGNRDTEITFKLCPQVPEDPSSVSYLQWGIIRTDLHNESIKFIDNYTERRLINFMVMALPFVTIEPGKPFKGPAQQNVNLLDSPYSLYDMITIDQSFFNPNGKYRIFVIYKEGVDVDVVNGTFVGVQTFLSPELSLKDYAGIGKFLPYLGYVYDYCGVYIGANVKNFLAGERLKIKLNVDFSGNAIQHFMAFDDPNNPISLPPSHILDILRKIEIIAWRWEGTRKAIYDNCFVNIGYSRELTYSALDGRLEIIDNQLTDSMDSIDIIYHFQSRFDFDINVKLVDEYGNIVPSNIGMDMSSKEVFIETKFYYEFNKIAPPETPFVRNLMFEEFSFTQSLSFASCDVEGQLEYIDNGFPIILQYEDDCCKTLIDIKTSDQNELISSGTCAVLRFIKRISTKKVFENDNENGSGEIEKIQQDFINSTNEWLSLGDGTLKNTMELNFCDFVGERLIIRNVFKQIGNTSVCPFYPIQLANVGRMILDIGNGVDAQYITRYEVTTYEACVPDNRFDIKCRRKVYEYIPDWDVFNYVFAFYQEWQMPSFTGWWDTDNIAIVRMCDLYKEQNAQGILYRQHKGFVAIELENVNPESPNFGQVDFLDLYEIYDYINSPLGNSFSYTMGIGGDSNQYMTMFLNSKLIPIDDKSIIFEIAMPNGLTDNVLYLDNTDNCFKLIPR